MSVLLVIGFVLAVWFCMSFANEETKKDSSLGKWLRGESDRML